MTEAATADQRRKRSRSPSLFPAQGRRHADPDRPLRRQAEGAGRQAPRQGGVHAGQVCFPRRPRRQIRQPHSGRRADSRPSSKPICSRAARRSSPSRARALAVAAIREACEETGLCLGRKVDKPDKLEGAWKPFADAGLLPDPSSLFLIARAITPPGRVRRFDTRFFTADASAIAHRVEGVIHADAELVELVWVEIGSKPLADAHAMTKNVLAELDRRLATGPLSHDAPVPFFHFYGGKMQKDVLGA